jgi:hypothetical protein
MAASRPTFPGDPHPRRLGTGGAPGGGERLLRAQLVIASVLGFTILAVILYLWRRPSVADHEIRDDTAQPSTSAAAPAPAIVRTKVTPPPKPVEKVKVGAVQRVKCGASAKHSGGEASLCDSLPFFEQALTKAVQDTVDCAPKPREGGTISFVLVVDFRGHEARVYPGKTGSWKGKQAKAAAECVKRAIPAPTWDTVVHQYRYYLFSVLATYPSQSAGDGLPNFQ